jgi:ribosomal protein S18 acetylase RimI-like enzyme
MKRDSPGPATKKGAPTAADDTQAIINILTNAFFDDPFYQSILPDKAARRMQLSWLMEVLARYGRTYGTLETSGDPVNGLVVWLKPDSPIMRMTGMIHTGILRMPLVFGLRGTAKIMRITDMWKELQKKEPKRHWYLLAIAVDPQYQRRGIGSALLQPVLAEADRSNLPCYLETMTTRDILFYPKHGFTVAAEGRIDDSIPFYTMRRPPKR